MCTPTSTETDNAAATNQLQARVKAHKNRKCRCLLQQKRKSVENTPPLTLLLHSHLQQTAN